VAGPLPTARGGGGSARAKPRARRGAPAAPRAGDPGCGGARSRPESLHALVLESHFAHERAPARIRMERTHARDALHLRQSEIPLDVRLLQPLEGGVDVATDGVGLRDLYGVVIAVGGDQVAKSGIRFGLVPERVVDDREHEQALSLVSLKRRCPERFVPAPLRRDRPCQDAVNEKSLGRDLERSPERRFRFREPPGLVERQAEIGMWWGAQRVLLRCSPVERYGLLDP